MYIKIVFLFSIRDLRANITTNIFSLFFSSFIPEPFLPISSLYAVFLAERLSVSLRSVQAGANTYHAQGHKGWRPICQTLIFV